MQQAKFSGLFAALSAEHRMNFIANNLANVNTAGYKQDKLAFKDTMIQLAHDQIREPIATVRSKPLFPEPNNAARVRIAVSNTDFAQGSMQFTGNPLDFAITGENGFFRIQSPQGDYLTRNGSFVLDATGQLVTKQGWPVLGDGGPITIPEGTKINKVELKGNTVYVDLSKEFIENHIGGEEAEKLTVYSIVNTLTELTEVENVKFLIDGEENKAFKDNKIKFDNLFSRLES